MDDIDDGGFENDFSNMIHIEMVQMGRRKTTIVSGIPEEFDYKKILRFWKKAFNTSGSIGEKDKDKKNKDAKDQKKEKEPNEKKGEVIRVFGDHREDISKFLQNEGIAIKENIRVHGI
jgi:translation initiation factor 1